jgi:hypothetical protein
MRTKLAFSLVCLLLTGCGHTVTGDDIDIIYGYVNRQEGVGTVLNTVAGTLETDLGMGPPTSKQLQLTGDERKLIYRTAKNLGFFELPREVVDTGDRTKTPCADMYLEIRHGGRSHLVKWDDCADSEPDALLRLRIIIYSIIASREPHKGLTM